MASARDTQKAVVAALIGLGDADIPAGLVKAARILRDAGVTVDETEVERPEQMTRTLRYGRDRKERGGKDRAE